MLRGALVNIMTRVHLNNSALAVLALCVGMWAVAAGSTLKLGDIYEHRGAHGFRHALMVRLEHRLGLQPRPSDDPARG